jgi:DNA-binding winged helix-turn-helix (wHTH) protein
MATSRLSGPDVRSRRRWSFAGRVFDEANWALIVDGRRVPIESKPLEMLRELLLRAGNVVSKDELLDQIWPDVTVVEASLPTAVRKLRVALGDHRRKRSIIETVSGIGYRLAVPVEVEELTSASLVPRLKIVHSDESDSEADETATAELIPAKLPKLLFISGGVAIALVAVSIAFAPSLPVSASRAARPYTQVDAANALRKLDVGKVEDMLAAGWNPNKPFDTEGNGAINYVLNRCEWDRAHDQEQMLLMVRTLIDGGAKLDHRNVWGDTPYSIAKAIRYCGPEHPVTRSIRTMCYAGYRPLGDRCLASYELAHSGGSTAITSP